MKRLLLSVLVLLGFAGAGTAEDLLAPGNLKHFRSTRGWRLVDMVRARDGKMELEIHGTGSVLVNSSQKAAVPYLYTKDEYADVAVDLEFMIPKGSNAGIYLQGRYEIQIFDSYGVDKPKYSDLGGLYERGGQADGYEGVPPRVNAARRPGAWQTLRIVFRGPRFDDAGRKIANARFERVVVNGQLVHENQPVTGPTRAAQYRDEQPRGPITIQGDHGPIAIRRFQVTSID